jgi:two-component system, NarL family, sensor histidine kinase DevS
VAPVRIEIDLVGETAQGPWALFESIPEMVVVVDLGGTVIFANTHTYDLLGWRPAELTGQQVEVLIPTALHDVHRAHRKTYHHSPKARPMGSGLLLSALHRDGHEVPVEIALSPLEGELPATVATVRDVTERLETSAQLLEARTRLEVLDDRDRIARELHDSVIQRLFAAGLHLQASTGRPDTADRVAAVVDEIDEAIREIRGVIFTLQRPSHLDSGLGEALRVSINESTRVLGFRPTLRVMGILGSVSEDVSAELLTVLREMLMNVAKHARATRTEVTVDVGSDVVTLVVADDGVGMRTDPDQSGGLGVRNITERAARLGGEATFSVRNPGGTEVRWTVPRQ